MKTTQATDHLVKLMIRVDKKARTIDKIYYPGETDEETTEIKEILKETFRADKVDLDNL
jgi:hypothetical protein